VSLAGYRSPRISLVHDDLPLVYDDPPADVHGKYSRAAISDAKRARLPGLRRHVIFRAQNGGGPRIAVLCRTISREDDVPARGGPIRAVGLSPNGVLFAAADFGFLRGLSGSDNHSGRNRLKPARQDLTAMMIVDRDVHERNRIGHGGPVLSPPTAVSVGQAVARRRDGGHRRAGCLGRCF
jgi:hypothetical protein